ncbi:pilus assembly protein TadG-related protein [Methylobacterium sp. P31]
MSDVRRTFGRDQQGSMAIAMPFLMLAVAGFTGLAVDVGNLYYTKLKLQKITDNAAAGAVLFLPDPTKATSTATNLVGLNTPSGYGTVAQSTDIQLGTWDSTAKTFTVTSSGQNAVKVTAHRLAGAPYNNPVLTYFGGVLGKKQLMFRRRASPFGTAPTRACTRSPPAATARSQPAAHRASPALVGSRSTRQAVRRPTRAAPAASASASCA